MDPFVLRHNERVKSLAGTVTNLGAGLFAVAVARLASKGDEVGILWIATALVLYWAGYMILGQLTSEDRI